MSWGSLCKGYPSEVNGAVAGCRQEGPGVFCAGDTLAEQLEPKWGASQGAGALQTECPGRTVEAQVKHARVWWGVHHRGSPGRESGVKVGTG